MTVDVILPALDEERALPGLLAALPAGYRAIVVDNGSTDGTAAVAAAGGALVRARVTPRLRLGLLVRSRRRQLGCRVLHGCRWLLRPTGAPEGR